MPTDPNTNRPGFGDALRLAVYVFAITWIALVGAPRLASDPATRARIETLHAAGIDPAAAFYTEHPAWRRLTVGDPPPRPHRPPGSATTPSAPAR